MIYRLRQFLFQMKKLLFGGYETTVTNDLMLALLRIFTGLSMAFGHGINKIPPSEGFIKGTAEMGFPFPTFFAYMGAYSEFFGGIFLAIGFMTRPSAFFMAATMFVAGFIRHADDPFSSAEKAYLYFVIGLVYMVIGSGRFSVDQLIRRRLNI